MREAPNLKALLPGVSFVRLTVGSSTFVRCSVLRQVYGEIHRLSLNCLGTPLLSYLFAPKALAAAQQGTLPQVFVRLGRTDFSVLE